MNVSQSFQTKKNKMTPAYESLLLLHHTKWKYAQPSNKAK